MYAQPQTPLSHRTRLIVLSCTLFAVLLILGAGAALASFPSSPPLGKPDSTSTSPAQPEITCSGVSFATAVNYGAIMNPYSVAVGDFNADGKQDIATANINSNNVSILLSTGNGSFGAANNFPVGTTPSSVAVGDFNADGKQDLAVSNKVSNNVSILLGAGNGSFGAANNFPVGILPQSVAVGDFNADGKQDIATANQSASSNNVSILLGAGNGTFGAANNFPVGSFPTSVAVGDFNADGKQDLATANLGANNVSILLGVGNGTFGAATNFPVGTNPSSVAVGDFNADGKQDLAASNDNNISILLGVGNGTFGAANNFPVGSGLSSVVVGDFNADGKQDLAASNGSNVSILIGTGSGSFGAAINFTAGNNPQSVAVGDFNADGRQDLAVANFFSNNVSVLLSNCAAVCQAGSDFIFVSDVTFGTSTQALAVGDFNRDALPDLAVANSGSNNVSVALGTGGGLYFPNNNFLVGTTPKHVAVGDFNGDGKPDIATANNGSNNISILLGDGAGSFAAHTDFGLNGGTGPIALAVGDFDRNGKQDLLTANFGTNNLSILLGVGNGTFPTATNISAATGPSSVAVGDWNSDGKQDLAVTSRTANVVTVRPGDGAGGFGTTSNVTFPAGSNPTWLAVGEFNSDGIQDLAVANNGSNNVTWLQGVGTGTFLATQNFGLNGGTGPVSVAVADFNGDAKQDLLTANNGTGNVSILFGTGTGSFGTAVNYGIDSGTTFVAALDFNRDGNPDLATTYGNSVLTRRNNCALIPTPTGTNTATVPTPTRTNTSPPGATNTPTRTSTSGATPTCSPGGLTEGFESGNLGAFTNVVPTCVPGGCNWTSTTGNPHSGTRSAFAPDGGNISDQYLQQTSALVPSAGSTLTFWHNYNTEATYDGGVLEATTNNGSSWQDMGSNITAGGYNGTINGGFNSPIAGRQAWTGNSGAYVQTTVNLTPYAGQSLRIRFRLATDQSQAAVGWDIDDISINTGCGPTSTPAPPTNTPTRTNTPPPGSTNTPTPTITRTPTRTNTSQAATPTRTSTNTPTNTPTRTNTAGPSPTPCVIGGLSEGFESGTLGAFTNVVPTCVPGGCNWTSVASNPHTGTRSAFAPDGGNISDQYLELTSGLSVASGSTLTFWHRYDLENTYDGGVLEATTNNGSTWTDMQPNITAGGYNGTIDTGFNSPIAGRQAWTGTNTTYAQVAVNLTPYAGQSLRIRFRLATDVSQSAVGWNIDDIAIAGVPCATNTPTITPTRTPTQPQATATNTPTSGSTPCAISFTDVPQGSTFYDFVRCMACRGIINGYTTGCDTGSPCFKPNNNITRGQLSKIVANAASFTEPAGAQQFEDVAPGSTFYDFVWRLFSRGIVNGYPCGGAGEPCGGGNLPYFRPNANVTRAQLAKIVSEGAGFVDPPSGQQFEDVPVGSTFYTWIWRLATRSVIGGYACGGAGEPCGVGNLPYFRPGANATRGQASKIVSNTFFPGCVTPQKR